MYSKKDINMSFNLVELIKGQLSPVVVSKLANQLGESESGVAKAISGLLPVVLGGLVENSSKDSVLDVIKNPQNQNILGDLLNTNNGVVSGLLQNIFGDKVGGLINGISSFSGVESSKVNSLLGVVTGAGVGSISKVVSENNLDVRGITSLIDSQKDSIAGLMPEGLSLPALGLGGFFASLPALGGIADAVGSVAGKVGDVAGNVGDLAGNVAGKVGGVAGSVAGKVGDVAGNVGDLAGDVAGKVGNVAETTVKEGSSLIKWLLPLLLLLLGGAFLFKKCGKDKGAEATTTEVVGAEATAEGDNAGVDGETTDVELADETATTVGDRVLEEIDLNGTKLKVYANGLESQIINFLKDGNYEKLSDEELKEKWFDFDNVTFVFGKTNQITEESKGQLQNLATVLKAYPNTKVKIGAYTDKKGGEEGNLKISQERAGFIKSELTRLGVGAQVESSEGYGEKFAKVDENASDEERKADRKISIRFVK